MGLFTHESICSRRAMAYLGNVQDRDRPTNQLTTGDEVIPDTPAFLIFCHYYRPRIPASKASYRLPACLSNAGLQFYSASNPELLEPMRHM